MKKLLIKLKKWLKNDIDFSITDEDIYQDLDSNYDSNNYEYKNLD